MVQVRISSIVAFVSVVASSLAAPLTNTVTAPTPPPGSGIYALAPLASCGPTAQCYQGPLNGLKLIQNLDRLICNDTITRVGGCVQYGFPKFKGMFPSPITPEIKVYEQTKGGHLWFRFNGGGCAEVDAATRMPAEIFEPENRAALQAYIKVTLNEYAGSGALAVGRCVDFGYTQYNGVRGGIDWIGATKNTCRQQCDCDPTSNGQHACPDELPDDPDTGTFCSLCTPKNNARVEITLYSKPQPTRPLTVA